MTPQPDTVSVTIETFAAGIRTDIQKFSVAASTFVDHDQEFLTNLNIALQHAEDEIRVPTPKTEMSNG
jgi:hypothetical protein